MTTPATTSNHEYADALGAFVTASPSSYHAAATVAARLRHVGFTELDEAVPFPDAPGRYLVRRDGAVAAWVIAPDTDPHVGYRIVGAHTDSPSFKLKPEPSLARAGWLQVGVEIYGGGVLTSWLDRELELAGRLVTRDGAEHLVRTGPFMRIPQLAPHLDRTMSDTVHLDRQAHTVPVWGAAALADGVDAAPDVFTVLAQCADLDPRDIAGYDIMTADTQAPRRFGWGGDLLASGRLDNLSSVFAGLTALERLAADGPDQTDGLDRAAIGGVPMLICFDHEELGSASRSGAAGPFLADLLTRIGVARGLDASAQVEALARSWCVSADAGHLTHPNYQQMADPQVRPVPGAGPLLKINANQRYATDAWGAALWARACAAAGVSYQEFVSNNAVPCGTTIGPLTATRLGIRTVDVGVGLLSMHSARELVHSADARALSCALEAFLAGGWD